MIVVHNHPSGDPTPSAEDVAVTRELVQAGKLLDIDVLCRQTTQAPASALDFALNVPLAKR